MKKSHLAILFFMGVAIQLCYATQPVTAWNVSISHSVHQYELESNQDNKSFLVKIWLKVKSKILSLLKPIFDDSLQIAFILLFIGLISMAGLFFLGSSSLAVAFLVMLFIAIACLIGSLIAFTYHFFS